MFVAAVIVSTLLAGLLTYSAVQKLSHAERVVQAYAAAGVPEYKLNLLATILLTGAAGLLVGLLWAPIGVAAAIGLVVYFLVAVGFHIRANDLKNSPTPVLLAALAATALALRLGSM